MFMPFCCSRQDTRALWVVSAVMLMILGVADLGDARQPNIVLIMADDLGYEAVGCYGGSYRTPNLDRLAAAGMRFNRAYAMPLCTNTRIQLMTGKYNLRNWQAFGILDPKERTFGHLLQQAGYKTCIAGKWQLTSYDPADYPGSRSRRNTGMKPQDAGFDQTCLWHVGHTETKGSRYADPVIEQNGRLLTDTQGKYGPDLWTDFIGDFIQQHQGVPFFVYYSMALPHNPMVPTPDSPEWRDPARRHIEQTRFAADMIEYTDKMVGKVIAQLEEHALLENTLILFYSDNGTNQRVASQFANRRVRGGKGTGTELGIRVPAMAFWPGTIPAGKVTNELIDSVDFLPTLLDAAGVPRPTQLDGVSFLPLARDGGPPPREWVYIHQDPRPGWDKDRFGLIRLAINCRFKLYEDGRLFDLQHDPFEESAHFVANDTAELRSGRHTLQQVLDSMKPYPMFDPKTVPRPNPHGHWRHFAFEEQEGLVVAEAETLPIPRDESWREEKTLPGFTGIGYLRALRDQPTPPDRGSTRIAAKIKVAGDWQLALRCRSDHPSGNAENKLWWRIADGPWQIVQLPAREPGTWQWLNTLSANPDGSRSAKLPLQEGKNDLWIAPYSANLKIDRIVLFQPDRADKALNLQTPMSPHHPW